MTQQIRGNTQIKSGTIEDAQIASAAAIATTKLADGANFIQKDGSVAFTANQSMGSFNLTNVADPTSAQHAATKAYVDAVAQGLRPKTAVKAATTANLPTLGIAPATLDGVSLTSGDRILVKDQTNPEENGIYIWINTGSVMNRAPDMDSLTPIDEVNGAYTFVQDGTQAGQGWVVQSTIATLDTDPMDWVYFNNVSSIIGGDMVTVTGVTIAVDLASTSGLESTNAGNSAGQLRVKLESSNPSLKIDGSNQLAAKLDAAGAITSGASGLIVGTDGSTVEISSNALRVKNNGIDENKLATSVAGAGLTGGGGSALAVGAGTGITVNANDVEVDTSVVLAKADDIRNEVPTGTINGSNTAFTLANTPFDVTMVALYLNGIRQSYTTHFSVSGTTLTYVTAPSTGDTHMIDYLK